jgi:hypothetical protein
VTDRDDGTLLETVIEATYTETDTHSETGETMSVRGAIGRSVTRWPAP